MGRPGAAVDAPEQEQSAAAAETHPEGGSMLEDRRRCGWGTVLAAVTLFATLVLTVPAGPGPG
jgi:hypothetical protein